MAKLFEFAGNHLFLVCLFASLLSFLCWDMCRGVAAAAKMLNPSELVRMLNRDGTFLLDLRPRPDYADGHILNARNIPASELKEQLGKLSSHQAQDIILCCGNGAESSRQAKFLRANGHEKVHILRGGMQEWRHANMPVSKGSASKGLVSKGKS